VTLPICASAASELSPEGVATAGIQDPLVDEGEDVFREQPDLIGERTRLDEDGGRAGRER